jgi:hypothetical protein
MKPDFNTGIQQSATSLSTYPDKGMHDPAVKNRVSLYPTHATNYTAVSGEEYLYDPSTMLMISSAN